MIFDGTEGNPLRINGGVDERGLARLEVLWLASTMEAAWGKAPPFYAGLKRTNLALSQQAGGVYHVSGTYEGLSPESGQNARDLEEHATYELDVTQATVPISQHPRLKELEAKFGKLGMDEETGLLTFPKEGVPGPGGSGQGPNGLGLSSSVGENRDGLSPAFGVTDFLDVGSVWRKRWVEVSREIPPELFDNLGRIDSPDGPVPQVGSGRNWLRSAVRASGHGDVWDLSIEWMLSGRGGWLPEIYRTQ